MKRPLRTTLAALAAGLALTAGLAAPAGAAPAHPQHPAHPAHPHRADGAAATVAAMQPGWNLGNSLDSVGPDETAWGNPRVTPELLAAVKDEGFRSVRVPVTWDDHQGGAPDYAIEADYLDRVEEVVDQALAEDLYVLLDVHHDSWIWANAMSSDPDTVRDRFRATWEQLAERFRDHSDRLLFESLNEPQFADVEDAQGDVLLDDLNTVFHEVVRASGGGNADRVLVLPTLHTNAGQERLDALASTIAALDDPHLAATVHYYGYWPFSVNVAGGTRFDADARADMTGTFDRVRDTFVDRGIPVILGEYGLLGFDRHTGTIEQGEKLKFFEELGHQAREAGVTTMLWDNGQHLDRTGFTWSDPELWAHVSSSWTTRSGTASTDQVFVRPGDVAPQTVTLEPHGTTIEGLFLDGEPVATEDAAVAGDELTLSAAYLERLIGDGSHGEHATLEARFSAGMPWRIHVIAADTPVLSDAMGSVAEGVSIPTQFRGDRLATMASVDAAGQPVGPQSWTPFQEFDASFAPDEEAGAVLLRPDYLATLPDGAPVSLTFHFWSGDTVDYTVTRSGDTVTGAAR
ncbi:cellulase family glycosylhydrolase [Isoptericola sp. F-RaC21]|uniref:cellulase family glycosylhydrolase n=1 Tax=Isoptericola sp. F-RaC21 TaxID=3141452 RepID=UPI00315C0665